MVLRSKSLIVLAVVISGIGLLAVNGGAARAAVNALCTDNGTTAECDDVTSDGILYQNGVSTVKVEGTVAGTPSVTTGTAGIYLSKSGGDAPDMPDETEFDTVMVDHDGDGGDTNPTPEVEVVADSSGDPVTLNSDYIYISGASGSEVYTSGTTDYDGDELIVLLHETGTQAGGAITGSLTINNPGTNPGSGASLTTSNAHGIYVKSQGGKGSRGGCSTILVYTWCDDGERGGAAGSVAVNSDTSITVNVSGSGLADQYGVYAVSQGGDGGNGGGSFGLFASDAGNGGNGGNGSGVTVTLGSNSGVTTNGIGGHGVFANSTGGNGGSGGSPSGLVALGNGGGNGGHAGVVNVSNDGSITTNGEKAYGIYARSIGAGAGKGSEAGGLVAIGGNGGGQTDGNTVTVTNTGSIETTNVSSMGIFAQSVGGGGGDGGGAGGLFTVGGKGGSGGNSDVVTVINSGSVTTAKDGSIGIFAQSVGGGGGNGGDAISVSAAISVAIGGEGGLGGEGDDVFVNLLDGSDINVGGDNSHGVLAQSIGGGGGNGGFAVSIAASPGPSLSVAVGGSGGSGGASGKVTVTSAAGSDISTDGSSAFGIIAQSIGGGGGNGGMAVSGSISTGGSVAVSVAVGGSGGGGGIGGEVAIDNDGSITTNGDESFGIVAQSIGGGGGNGGFTVAASVGSVGISVGSSGSGGTGGTSDKVEVYNDGAITTDGDRSKGIFAQSIGGGGGSGGFSISAALGGGAVSVGVGGSGASGGSVGVGKTVLIDNGGSVLTQQIDSHGLHAQSVGGGGGAGGSTVSAALSGGVVAGSVAVGVGGDGGGGGSGQGVRVVNTGEIETKEDRSYGIIAQSIGGGGGDGGFAVAAAVSFSEKLSVAVGVPIGGSGGDAGTGSWVDINNSNSITTGGGLSHGILGQSIGGGGGAGGASISATVAVGTGPSGAVGVSIGGGGGTGGTSGRVDVNNSGIITTTSEGATGIRAQSIGGGGGTGGFAGGFGLTVGGSGSAAANITVGGGGGTGNYASVVDVSNSAALQTSGDTASGIYAESIGGGGGSGGGTVNVSAAFSTSGNGMALGVGIGGAGGGGNDGAVVQVVSDGNITTGAVGGATGFMSHGIHATSIGGGGGSGGFVASVAASGSAKAGGAVAVSVGGSAGDGGIGRNVGVGVDLNQTDIVGNVAGANYGSVVGSDAITGTITTNGDEAHGIYANSIGGGGGNGGFAGAFTGSFNTSSSKTLSLSVAVGGAGGDGGFAGDVFVNSAATMLINGNRSNGILAQSIGGGGGNGGGSAAGAFGSKDSITVNVAVGGLGGLGTVAGNVTVDNSGDITLSNDPEAAESEDKNAAILAQSIGGGGGNGGFAFSTSVGGPENKGLNVSVGGNGGGIKDAAGDAKTTDGTDAYSGAVTINNSGVLYTSGGEAHGILGQSIGGSGGNGGFAAAIGISVIPADETKWSINASVAVGGVGGDGNEGGVVTITNENLITTGADNSHAIYGQSVGGGGGNGGMAFSGNIGLGDGEGKSFQAAVSVGGNGGDGDHGGLVTINNDSDLETFGDISHGVLAQSVGGGGGAGGGANALNVLLNAGNFDPFAEFSTSNLKLEISVGGTGGSGQNDGGVVDVTNQGDITTHGEQSRGIWAQSIGGGGGNGGMGALSTGFPEADLAIAIATCLPCNLPNIVDPTDLSVIVGGDAGANGHGKSVNVDNGGMITTTGSFSHAIFAQSVGGGGGEALLWSKDTNSSIGGDAAIGPNGKFGIGGAGGAAGNGGDVTVNLLASGGIETWGTESHGIFAQSVGGGGGMAGSIDRTLPNPDFLKELTGVTDFPNIGLGFGFARSGGGGGDGGDIVVTSDADITTHGNSSIGILAQSVGGGGGLAGGTGIGLTISVFSGSVGGDGDAGKVTVNQTGTINTSGAYAAHGIFAQSAGGGSGTNVGMGKDVTITLDGEILATGQNAIGILAQSTGVDGQGDITVTLEDGSSVYGGTLAGLVTPDQPEVAAAIQLLDGSNNAIVNYGLISTFDGLTGYAARGTTGDDRIDNHYMMTGMINLGSGLNAYNNQADARFDMGAIVDLGGGRFTNYGFAAPGGDDVIQTTLLTGDYSQISRGHLLIDWDYFSSTADQLAITGTADLDGELNLTVIYRGFAVPGVDEVTVVTADGGVSDLGMELVVFDPAVASYEMLFPNANDVVIRRAIDFAPDGISGNQTSMGGALNDVQTEGSFDGFDEVILKVYSIGDLDELALAYDHLGTEVYGETKAASILNAFEFSNNLMSCKSREGDDRFIRQDTCRWARYDVSRSEREASSEAIGMEQRSHKFAMGVQRRVGDETYVGFGGSYKGSSMELHKTLTSQSGQAAMGVSVKRQSGNVLYATTGTIGMTLSDVERWLTFLSDTDVAKSQHKSTYLAGHARASYLAGGKTMYLVPSVDFGATFVKTPDITETGSTIAALKLHGHSEMFFGIQPSLEFGGEFEDARGTQYRPFVKAGFTRYFGETTSQIEASFTGAPAGAGSFVEEVSLDDVQLELAMGIDILTVGGGVLRLGYEGRFSDGVERNTGFVKLALPW